MPIASASQELRKGIVLRLGFAIAVLIAVALAWHAFEPGVPAPEEHGAAVASPHSSGPLVTAQVDAPSAQQSVADSTTSIATAPVTPVISAASASVADVTALESHDELHHSEGIIRTLRADTGDEKSESQQAAAVTAPAPAQNAKTKLPSGPHLQVGVFTHPENAAELKARLEAEGIPVVVATRVLVGPFKSKKEAEAMREKLKAMGMESRLINP